MHTYIHIYTYIIDDSPFFLLIHTHIHSHTYIRCNMRWVNMDLLKATVPDHKWVWEDTMVTHPTSNTLITTTTTYWLNLSHYLFANPKLIVFSSSVLLPTYPPPPPYSSRWSHVYVHDQVTWVICMVLDQGLVMAIWVNLNGVGHHTHTYPLISWHTLSWHTLLTYR